MESWLTSCRSASRWIRITRTRPFPYLFLISGTRTISCSAGEFENELIAAPRPILANLGQSRPIMSNLRAIGQALSRKYGGLARALYRLAAGRPARPQQEGPVDEHR